MLTYDEMEGYDGRYDTAGSGLTARGRLTGTVARVLSGTSTTTTLLPTAFYYDIHGNVIQSRSVNHRGGREVERRRLTFTGKPLTVRREHTSGAQPYKYGGKELDRENGWDSYDFEARVYDPALGRFTAPDPLAWDTPEVSPYVYCAANPIRYVDPSGKVVQFADGVLDMLGDSFEQLIENSLSTIFSYDPDYKRLMECCLDAMLYREIPINLFIGGGYEFIQHYKSLGKTDDAYVRNITRASNVIQQFISVR